MTSIHRQHRPADGTPPLIRHSRQTQGRANTTAAATRMKLMHTLCTHTQPPHPPPASLRLHIIKPTSQHPSLSFSSQTRGRPPAAPPAAAAEIEPPPARGRRQPAKHPLDLSVPASHTHFRILDSRSPTEMGVVCYKNFVYMYKN